MTLHPNPEYQPIPVKAVPNSIRCRCKECSDAEADFDHTRLSVEYQQIPVRTAID